MLRKLLQMSAARRMDAPVRMEGKIENYSVVASSPDWITGTAD